MSGPLVDLSNECINAATARFANDGHVSCHVNDGKSLAMIPDDSIDFLFSFDSLVHVDAGVLERRICMTIDRRRVLAIAAGAALPSIGRAFAAPAAANEKTISVLQTQTQALMDAVGPGDAAVWARILHDDAVYTTEDGDVFDKKQMVDQTKPHGAGVTGVLKVIDFKAKVHEGTAITTYVVDEDESYHGHKLHCRYRSTDTWVKTAAGWRLLASQVLALKTDPPAITLSRALAEEYCGRYSLTPEIGYEIRRKPPPTSSSTSPGPEGKPGEAAGPLLEGQQTGRPAKDLRAEAPDVLFAPRSPRYRYIFQRNAAGKITGFAQRREAWDLVWKREAPSG